MVNVGIEVSFNKKVFQKSVAYQVSNIVQNGKKCYSSHNLKSAMIRKVDAKGLDRELLLVELKRMPNVENGLGAAYRTLSRLRRDAHSLQQQQYAYVLAEADDVSHLRI